MRPRSLVRLVGRMKTITWDMLATDERKWIALLAVAMAFGGFLQSVSLVALLPFLAVMLDPTAVQGHGFLAALHRMLGRPDVATFTVLCAFGVFAAIALKSAFDVAYAYALNRLVARVERRTAAALLEQCLAGPYAWFLTKSATRLLKEVFADVVTWARVGLKSVLSLVGSAIALASVVTVLVILNPVFGAAVTVAGTLLSLAIFRGLRPWVRRLALAKHVAHDEMYMVASHALFGAKDIKINGKEAYFTQEFEKRYGAYASHQAVLGTLQRIPGAVVEVAVALFVVVIGMYVANHDALRAEVLSLAALYGVGVIRVFGIFNEVSATLTGLQAASPAVEGIRRTRAEMTIPPVPAAEGAVGAWNRITLRDVAYRYPEGHADALTGVSLDIERGARVGVVGRSGAGKTTFVDVVTGLLTPSAGTVRIGDTLLDAHTAPAWRRQLGYVPQSPFIADASLRFNVALTDDVRAIDESRVLAALDAAHFGEVLRRELPDGLDTMLGDRGIRLSGGQRQRVAIARALYRSPALLILDEATSALDSESEHAVATALRRLPANLTIVVIAHRLSTVRSCDTIVVFDGGAVVASGSHAALMRDCALYRRFVELGDLSREPAEVA